MIVRNPRRRPGSPQGLDPFWLIEVDRLDEQDRRLEAVATAPVHLGTIATGTPVEAHGSVVLPSSYTTNGFAFDTSLVPGIVDVRIAPKSDGAGVLYTFEWNGSDKVVVYQNGTEVPATFDLTILGAQPFTAIGTQPTEYMVWTAVENEALLGADLYVSTTLEVDAADYWSIELVQRTPDGEKFTLDTITTDILKLKANVARRIADGTTLLAPGDTLLLDVSDTGTPAALEQLAVWPQIRRRIT